MNRVRLIAFASVLLYQGGLALSALVQEATTVNAITRALESHGHNLRIPIDRSLPPFSHPFQDPDPPYPAPTRHITDGDWLPPEWVPPPGGALYVTKLGFRPEEKWSGYVLFIKVRFVDHDCYEGRPVFEGVHPKPRHSCNWPHWRYYSLADPNQYWPVHFKVMYAFPPPPCPAHVEFIGTGDNSTGICCISMHGLEQTKRWQDAEPAMRALALLRQELRRVGRMEWSGLFQSRQEFLDVMRATVAALRSQRRRPTIANVVSYLGQHDGRFAGCSEETLKRYRSRAGFASWHDLLEAIG